MDVSLCRDSRSGRKGISRIIALPKWDLLGYNDFLLFRVRNILSFRLHSHMITLNPHSIFQTLQSSNLFLKCCPVSWQCFVSDGGERSTQSGAGSLWWGGIKFGNHKLGQQIQSGTQQLFLPATGHLPQLRPLFNQKPQNYHKLSSNIQQGQISSCGDEKTKQMDKYISWKQDSIKIVWEHRGRGHNWLD